MAKVRKDNKGRNLRPGETQRADGSYMYVYKLGTKKKYLYDSDLASLRVKEKQIDDRFSLSLAVPPSFKCIFDYLHIFLCIRRNKYMYVLKSSF